MNNAVAEDAVEYRPSSAISADDICKVLRDKRIMLLGLILRFEADWDTAEDILALASVEALANAGNFKGDASLASFIGGITLNVARRHARRQATRKNGAGVFYQHELPSNPVDDEELSMEMEWAEGVESADPERILETSQTLARIQQALARIEKQWPEAYRIWHMYRLDELSYQEIEEQAGVRSAAARTHVFRVSKELERLTGLKPETAFS